MNTSISNILEIYRLVAQQNYSLDEAAKKVGKKNNVDYADLLSSCTKELNISPDKFYFFLESKDNFNFKNFLLRRFPAHQDRIITFFDTFEDTNDIPILDFSRIIKPSSNHEKKSFSSHIILNSLREIFLDWIARPDIPQDVKDDLKGWIRKIDG